MTDDSLWDLLLRGAVGVILLFHPTNLMGLGPRAAACRARRVVDLHALAGGLPVLAAGAGMVALGLAANAPRLEARLSGGADPGPETLPAAHAVAMAAFTAAAVWEVLRGWRDDLVEPRREARRGVALGIGLYAAIAGPSARR